MSRYASPAEFFAAFDGASIYAVGATPAEAVANARRETQAPDATFETAPIRATLAAFIDEHGWDLSRSFAVDAEGFLVDTTGEGR